MNHWQITKYDPAFRDESGAYRKDEWIAYGDIGYAFDGVALTYEEYMRTEDCYVAAALAFLKESGAAPRVRVVDPELLYSHFALTNGMHAGGELLETIIRENLRSHIWCKLEALPDFYLHFGHDYYMFIGSSNDLAESVQHARRIGLFVEECVSPHWPGTF